MSIPATTTPDTGENPSVVTVGENEVESSLRVVPAPGRGVEAGPRGRPRESVPETNTPGELHAGENESTQRDERAERAARMRSQAKLWLRPPNPRQAPAPSWNQLRWHADHGQHVAPEGASRIVTTVWCRTVALPARVAAVWLDWVARSPTRTTAVIALYVICHYTLAGWLPWPTWLP